MNEKIKFLIISGRISEEYCICYADENGNPDGQAGINGRVRDSPIGIVNIKTEKFVTKPSSSINDISQAFAKYLPYTAEEIAYIMKRGNEIIPHIPNSLSIPFEE